MIANLASAHLRQSTGQGKHDKSMIYNSVRRVLGGRSQHSSAAACTVALPRCRVATLALFSHPRGTLPLSH